jgi:hypothetical protein
MKIMAMAQTLTMTLQLKFHGKKSMGQFTNEGLVSYWKTSKQRNEMARKQKRNNFRRKKRLDKFSRLLEEPSLATTLQGVYFIFLYFWRYMIRQKKKNMKI